MSSSSGTEDSTSSEENEETQVSLAKSPSKIQKDLIIMKICNIILIIMQPHNQTRHLKMLQARVRNRLKLFPTVVMTKMWF